MKNRLKKISSPTLFLFLIGGMVLFSTAIKENPLHNLEFFGIFVLKEVEALGDLEWKITSLLGRVITLSLQMELLFVDLFIHAILDWHWLKCLYLSSWGFLRTCRAPFDERCSFLDKENTIVARTRTLKDIEETEFMIFGT